MVSEATCEKEIVLPFISLFSKQSHYFIEAKLNFSRIRTVNSTVYATIHA